MQQRPGPNRVGPNGWLQSLADGLKLAFKEDIMPVMADKRVYFIAPVISTIPAFVAFSVIPFGGEVTIFGEPTVLQLVDLPVGVLVVLACSAVGVYGIVLGGWSSGSPYPLLAALRSAAQVISYEIALGLSVVGIKKDSPAGRYLTEHGVSPKDFNSYGSRRGNHEVMIRGTFANIRLRNLLAPGTEGGFTRHLGSGERRHLRRRRSAMPPTASAGDPRRQGVRLGLVPGLGREGHRAARRAGRDRRVLRADPPVEPDRHGRPSAAVRRRRHRRVARADRRGDVLDRRSRRGGRGAACRAPCRSRRHGVRRHRPHRHPRRAGVLPARRDHAVRAAAAAGRSQQS